MFLEPPCARYIILVHPPLTASLYGGGRSGWWREWGLGGWKYGVISMKSPKAVNKLGASGARGVGGQDCHVTV